MTDHELIAGCLTGHQRSWNIFCGRFSKLIHWGIRKTLADSPFNERQDIAEDVFQDVFRRFLDRNELANLKEAESVRKYLFVTACHAAKDRIRTLRRQETSPLLPEDGPREDQLIADDADPASAASTNEHRGILEKSLGSLRPKEREALELFYLDGFTHKSIGTLLGFTENAVEALIRRTREKLKEALGEKGMEGVH